MAKQSALHDRLSALTDQWMELFGYALPIVVSDPMEEYRAVRQGVALMDFSFLRRVDVEGPGAVAEVNRIVARDLTVLRPGQIAYGAACDENGGMLDDCTVMIRDADRVRVCCASDHLVDLLRAAGDRAGLAVRERTDELPHLCVQGPASRAVLASMTDTDLSPQAFPYYTFRERIVLAGIPAFVTRMGYTAELGYEVLVERDQAVAMWDALTAAGEPYGMRAVGAAALTLVRIEGGLILAGAEYDETVSPFECGLGWSVALDKGPFLGRDALTDGYDAAKLQLTSVVLDGGPDGADGAALVVNGAEVGRITQAVAAPHLGGRTLALALVDPAHAGPGCAVEAKVGEGVSGRTVAHPVYDPYRARCKLS